MPSRLAPGLLLCLLILGVNATPVHSQRLEDGANALDKTLRQTKELRKQLFRGEVAADPKNKNHLDAILAASKEAVWYLYWDSIDRHPAPGKIAKTVDLFERSLSDLGRAKGTGALTQLYSRNVIDRAQEVIQKGKPIAGLNAARILALIAERRLDRGLLQAEKQWVDETLPRLAEGNAEHLAATCTAALADPKGSDGTRYYLLRALGNVLALPRQETPLLKKETEDKAVLAALRLAERQVPFPAATPREEIEGYKLLRRAAVRVVAQGRSPVIGDKERPALLLARFAGNDESLRPSPRLDERIEAALGLCQLAGTAAKFPDFQLDNAAYQVAWCVRDLAVAANENLDSKEKLRLRPWRVDAARMLEGLDRLKAAKSPYINDVVKQCVAVLTPIEDKRQGPADTLTNWLEQDTNKEKGKPLFKSVADTVVKRGAAED